MVGHELSCVHELLASLPSSVPSATCARRMSPVEMWQRESSHRRSACVLPGAGGPSRMRFNRTRSLQPIRSPAVVATGRRTRSPALARGRNVAATASLLQESLVAAHHQLGPSCFIVSSATPITIRWRCPRGNVLVVRAIRIVGSAATARGRGRGKSGARGSSRNSAVGRRAARRDEAAVLLSGFG